MTTGKAPTLRHMKRTHGVSLAWVHERVSGDDVHLYDCSTQAMAADIFTKQFTNSIIWRRVCMLVGVVDSKFVGKVVPGQ